jgi:formylglycine-generating enzyme required for sulfatase activity
LLSIKSKRLIVFMDSCYSGGVSEKKARDVKIVEDPYEKIAEGEGRLVIAASQPDQRSFEDKNLSHGIFTYHLIEALKGKADLDNDGYVTAMEVYKYLSETVTKTARRLAGGAQEPILRGDLKTDFVLTVSRKRIEEIKDEDIKRRNLKRLSDWYHDGKFGPAQYELACRLIESSPEDLRGDDKKVLKSLNDLLSDKISISTFQHDVESIKGLEEPPVVISKVKKRKREEQETRQEEEKKKATKRRARDEFKTQKKILAVILAVILVPSAILLGFWMFAPDSAEHTIAPTPTADIGEAITDTIDMEFVLIPAGKFEMGSPSDEEGRYSDEGPVHPVNIEKAFYMGRYEVTQKQWRAIMGDNPSGFKGYDLPVETVSWDDVQEFIKKLNEKEGTDKYRLPSEAEWEYACRAGTTTRYSFGGSMTCTAMSGNGCRIAGMIAMTAHLLTVVHGKEMAPSGSFAVVAGATSPGIAALRIASGAPLASATATSAFAF